jgi:hypothetical protein
MFSTQLLKGFDIRLEITLLAATLVIIPEVTFLPSHESDALVLLLTNTVAPVDFDGEFIELELKSDNAFFSITFKVNKEEAIFNCESKL